MHRITRVKALVSLAIMAVALLGTAPQGAQAAPEPLAVGSIEWTDTSHAWVVGEGGSMLATNDGGVTWRTLWVPSTGDLTDVRFISSTQGWVCTSAGEVLRTTDGGVNWARTRVTSEGLLALDFADTRHGWVVGSSRAAYRTTDGGVTWTSMTLPPQGDWPRPFTDVSFVSANTGWICGDSAVSGDGFEDLYIAKTTNGGLTWTRTPNPPYMPGGSDDMWGWNSMDFADASHGWIAGWLPGLHSTDDGGATWSPDIWLGDTPTDIDAFDAQHVATTSGPFWDLIRTSVTRDGGANWTTYSHPLTPGGLPEYYFSGSDISWQGPDDLWMVGGFRIIHLDLASAEWDIRLAEPGAVEHVGGRDRYATSVEISRKAFAAAQTVVITSGSSYADALVASGLCGAEDAPLLLTAGTLPSSVRDEIIRLGADRVIVLGGAAAVPPAVTDALEAIPGISVERIGGSDRYDTARLVAAAVESASPTPRRGFVVRGDAYPDALAVAPVAYASGSPVFLVTPTAVPSSTRVALRESACSTFTVVGGPSAVGDTVVASLSSITGRPVGRVASGADRYATAAEVARFAVTELGADPSVIGLASGLNFPDALAAGPALGSGGHVLLLTDPHRLSPATAQWVEANPVETGWVLGNRVGAVGDPAANAFSLRIP